MDPRHVEEIALEHLRWIRDEDKRQDAAERRNRDLIAVHREGWKLAADAIARGFRDIATAIERANR